MRGISFSGLASGIDSAAIIDALISAERVPINILEARKAESQEKIDLLGTLKGLVQDLESKAQALGSLASFMGYEVSASTTGIATFSASGSASAGSHTLEVTSLASAHRIAFDGVSDPTTPLAGSDGETLSFDYGGTNYQITVNAATSSLNEIAAAINEATGGEVVATIVNSGTAASPSHQLVLAGKDTGSDKQITNLATTIAGLGGTTTLTTASDAVAIIDGLQITRSTNDFNDVIEGVSISLQATNVGDPIAFTVAVDSQGIKDRIGEFVDAYNAVIDFIETQSQYDEDAGAGGALFGDTVLRSITSTLQNVLFSQSVAQVQNDPLGFGTLRLVGISQDDSGRLSVDDTAMDAKMAEDLDAFADLFVDTDGFDNGGLAIGDPDYLVDLTADSGLADTLARHLDFMMTAFTDPTSGVDIKGLFDSRTAALSAQIEEFDKTIERREVYLEKLEQNLLARFTALEQLMAQLNAQQAYLTQQLSQLPSYGSSS